MARISWYPQRMERRCSIHVRETRFGEKTFCVASFVCSQKYIICFWQWHRASGTRHDFSPSLVRSSVHISFFLFFLHENRQYLLPPCLPGSLISSHFFVSVWPIDLLSLSPLLHSMLQISTRMSRTNSWLSNRPQQGIKGQIWLSAGCIVYATLHCNPK